MEDYLLLKRFDMWRHRRIRYFPFTCWQIVLVSFLGCRHTLRARPERQFLILLWYSLAVPRLDFSVAYTSKHFRDCFVWGQNASAYSFSICECLICENYFFPEGLGQGYVKGQVAIDVLNVTIGIIFYHYVRLQVRDLKATIIGTFRSVGNFIIYRLYGTVRTGSVDGMLLETRPVLFGTWTNFEPAGLLIFLVIMKNNRDFGSIY